MIRSDGMRMCVVIKCPVCGGKFKVEEYKENWRVVERHNYCDRCGYREEQCYNEGICGFEPPIEKGYKGRNGKYIKKNIRKRKRIKRKYNIKYGNKDWIFNYI